MATHVYEGEENLCSIYSVSFGFDLMPGVWTSNSGGTFPKAGVVSGV